MQDPLVRRTLPNGWIDLAVGEARVVRESLFRNFRIDDIVRRSLASPQWDYQHPSGLPALVRFLEEKHQAPIVVTCGAKQGLAAAFYALKKRGKTSVGMGSPYWSQMPQAIVASGLDVVTGDPFGFSFESYLHVAPNNPDGHLMTPQENVSLYHSYRDRGVPFVHDAAYYSDVYVPNEHMMSTFGDVRIFSVSKSYGLSGLRLGYVVCDDTCFYNDILEYVETATVGVSSISQALFLDVLHTEKQCPDLREKFVNDAKNSLLVARKLAIACDPAVLHATSACQTGMFGWYKKGLLFDPEAARVAVADGSLFGDSQMVRLNLAASYDDLKEALARLHNVANVQYLA